MRDARTGFDADGGLLRLASEAYRIRLAYLFDPYLAGCHYDWLGPKKSRKIQLAVMDMWKPFRNVTKDKAPQAAILFDKFHIMRHLGEALDKVRKAEYARVNGKSRRFQKYNLLSRYENLTLEGKRSLKILLAANKRLNTAYILKEAFGQLWDYGREG
jgi:transposase